MKTRKLLPMLVVLAGSAALTVQTGFAQPSNVSLTNSVVGVTNVVWDFSKLTNELQNIDLSIQKNGQVQVEIAYPDPYTQDGRGRLAGGPDTNTVTVMDQNNNGGFETNEFQGLIVSRGSVSGNKGVAHLSFTTRVSGKADLQSKVRSVSAGGTYNVTFDAVNDLITVKQSEHASATGLGSIADAKTHVDGFSTNADLVAELGDGTWTLVLNFTNAPGVTKLGGDASVSLESGQVYPFTFKGVFAPHSGLDKMGQSLVNLKGYDAGLGCTLAVTLNSSNSITRIAGRISGQTVNIKQ